jgi:DTW domain-containing protein
MPIASALLPDMSPNRAKRKPRCPGCGLIPTLCACALFPRIRVATPIAIVRHVREQHKPTNTGRLFSLMVEGVRILPCGMREPAFDPSPIQDPSIDWRLLYPAVGAPPLSPGKNVGIVLLDGAWSQCAHMRRRIPAIKALPCVALPPGTPSFWRVRSQPREEGRSTFEAALHALEILEGAAAVASLKPAFAAVTARLHFLKGKLRSPEVPAEWGVTSP